MKKTLTIITFLFVVIFAFCKKEKGEGKREKEPDPVAKSVTVEEIKEEKSMEKVFKSKIAGRWYPGNEKELKEMVSGFFRAVPHQPIPEGKRLFALISPHAGLIYSGAVAAYGYNLLDASIKKIIVLGPSHYYAMNHAAVPEFTHIETPLGKVTIDIENVEKLLQCPHVKRFQAAFEREHSVEIQFPFIQAQLPDVKITPVVVGQIDLLTAAEFARCIQSILTPETLIVVSSDFTHYGPNYGYVPFRSDIEKNLKKLADSAFEVIAGRDPKKFDSHLNATGDTICGEKPIKVLLNILPPDAEAKLLKYDTSGRITSDFSNSVSYLSIAFFTKKETLAYHGIRVIDREDEKTLLRLARLTLRNHLQKKPPPDPLKEGFVLSPAVKERYGVFVTLKKNERLRGCIGTVLPTEPLFEGVIRNAINAASHDTRFEPVRPEEEKDIHIEISVLSKPQKVRGFKDIVIGRDGIIISKMGRRALFLPQVPVEENWDLDTTLSHLSMKAGLPSNAYKEGMEFETFMAQVFGEE